MSVNDIARQVIDAKRARLGEEMRVLCADRNKLAPISLLHTEILAEIFIRFALMCVETELPQECSRISHVSRHWRVVALNCPQIWVHILTSSSGWTEAMLTRSKSLPIIVDSNWGNQFIGPALRQFGRIKQLYLDAETPEMSRITRAIEGPAPHLETCHIRTKPSGGCPPTPFEITPSMTTRLRILSLSGYQLRRDAVLPADLTSLSITGVASASLLTPEELLGALRHASRLVDLTLRNCLPRPAEEAVFAEVQAEVVNLQHLKRFILSGAVLPSTQVLELIHFPPDVELSVEVMSDDKRPALHSRLAHAMNEHVIANPPEELQILFSESQGDRPSSVALFISRSEHAMDKDLLSLVILAHAELDNFEIFENMTRALLSEKLLKTLEFLQFDHTGPYRAAEDEVLFDVFRHANLRKVHNLALDGDLATRFIDLLDPESTTTANNIERELTVYDDASRPWMPSLHTLIIRQAHYKDTALINTLRHRSEMDAKMPKLVLNRRELDQTIIAEIEPIVGSLDWSTSDLPPSEDGMSADEPAEDE